MFAETLKIMLNSFTPSFQKLFRHNSHMPNPIHSCLPPLPLRALLSMHIASYTIVHGIWFTGMAVITVIYSIFKEKIEVPPRALMP